MTMTTTIIFVSEFGEVTYADKEKLRIASSFVILLIGFKFFEWLRLFDSTSFYIKLLITTFYDIGYFMILFFGSLYTIGLALYFIAENNVEEDYYLIKPSDKWFSWDLMIN